MPRSALDDDDTPDDWDDEPGDDDDEPTIPCPYCSEEIHEDSPRCPHCEHYLPDEDVPSSRKPVWIIAGALLCLLAIYFGNQWINFLL